MADQFKLVFAGEIAEGQHPAVVRKRLADVLKLAADDARMQVLFSGKSVVVKKSVTEEAARRYRAAFESAGAQLEVLPVESGDDPGQAAAPASASGLETLPVGSDILTEQERAPLADAPVPDVDFDLAELGADLDTREKAAPPRPPDTSHISLQAIEDTQVSKPERQ